MIDALAGHGKGISLETISRVEYFMAAKFLWSLLLLCLDCSS
jgi:hypothetical protein